MKDLNKFLLGAVKAEKDLKEHWEQLKNKYEELKKFLPGLTAPWLQNQNIQLGVNVINCSGRSGGIRKLIIDILPENSDHRIDVPALRDIMKDSGYGYNYIYNSIWGMVKEDMVIDGFRVERLQLDEERRPRFYKVKVTDQNA